MTEHDEACSEPRPHYHRDTADGEELVFTTTPTPRPWCCPEPRCIPLHSLQGSDKPLDIPDPGETFLCFGKAPEVTFIYDGSEHTNDVRSCTYTALKGVISFQENADDWQAIGSAYGRALTALRRHLGQDVRRVGEGY